MDYERAFEDAINRLRAEKRYRSFANLERDAKRFPMALWRPAGEEDQPRRSRSGAQTTISAWAATRM